MKRKTRQTSIGARTALSAAETRANSTSSPIPNRVLEPADLAAKCTAISRRKYLISRKFPPIPKNAAQKLSNPAPSTLPSQVPAITNSNLFPSRPTAPFIIPNSEFIIPRPRPLAQTHSVYKKTHCHGRVNPLRNRKLSQHSRHGLFIETPGSQPTKTQNQILLIRPILKSCQKFSPLLSFAISLRRHFAPSLAYKKSFPPPALLVLSRALILPLLPNGPR